MKDKLHTGDLYIPNDEKILNKRCKIIHLFTSTNNEKLEIDYQPFNNPEPNKNSEGLIIYNDIVLFPDGKMRKFLVPFGPITFKTISEIVTIFFILSLP